MTSGKLTLIYNCSIHHSDFIHSYTLLAAITGGHPLEIQSMLNLSKAAPVDGTIKLLQW